MNARKVIHQGGGHFVTCDGITHVTTFWNVHTHLSETYVQGTCFCQDPEFIADGYSFELQKRYEIAP